MQTVATPTQVMFEPVEGVENLPFRRAEGFTVGVHTPDFRFPGEIERHSQVQLVPPSEFDAYYAAIDERSPTDPEGFGFKLTTPEDSLYYWLTRLNHHAEQLGSSLFDEKLTLQRIGSSACRLMLPIESKLRVPE